MLLLSLTDEKTQAEKEAAEEARKSGEKEAIAAKKIQLELEAARKVEEEKARGVVEEARRIAEEARKAEEEARKAKEARKAEEAREAKEEARKAKEALRIQAEEEEKARKMAKIVEAERLAAEKTAGIGSSATHARFKAKRLARIEDVANARKQPQDPEKEKLVAAKYAALSPEKRAFSILYDLGMIEATPDPDDPEYDSSYDEEFCPENSAIPQ